MPGFRPSPLEIIKPQIDRAVELVDRVPDERAWIDLLAPTWVDAVSALIRYALLQEGRRDAAEIGARRFQRMSYAEQCAVAAQHGIAMDQFVRIVRTACGFRRSSERPPPLSSAPPPRIPRHSDAERLGVIVDPRMRKANPR